ncbi:class I SAM-dependent methyltransferase [Ignavibacteria bacterium]|nr:class I SAM-dependent methyltransferase [Bacteroidota bacterium]MCZ2133395.1 class I SAM-dependent methyltransferase [Bacteroidota bacterium]
MKEFWNERFGRNDYVYGASPNEYFKKKIAGLAAGRILFPCEGEGRNSVYAASLGWEAEAFDQSEAGKKKAEALAQKSGVRICYTVADAEEIEYPAGHFDAIALIYSHFPEEKRKAYHRKLCSFLKKGGYLILEGFGKRQTEYQKANPNAGGPRDTGMLLNLEELRDDFAGFDMTDACETEAILNEGEFHQGESFVVRIFGVKR